MSKNAVVNQKSLAYQAEVERKRIGPIYDIIETGNFKQALKQINAHLKKHPDSQQGKCCKALILEKMGELEEAYAICKEVQAEKPTDNGVLNQLRLVFKCLGKLHDNTILCETALAADPKNKALAKNLFFAWVKEVDFKNQQQAAMKLFQTFKSEKYFYWSLVSNFLQAGGRPFPGDLSGILPDQSSAAQEMEKEKEKEPTSGGEKEKELNLGERPTDLRLLGLCEAMLAKRCTEHPPNHLGILLLYISVLTSQGKYNEALAVLSGPHAALFKMPQEKKKYTANLLIKLQKWDEVHELTKDLLHTHEPDDWAYWTTFLDTLFLLRKESKEKGEGRLKEAYAFLKEMQDKNSLCRGTFLAEIELERRLLEESEEGTEKYVSLLVNYFARFSEKLCCYMDMKDLLGAVAKKPEQEQQKFMEALQSTIPALGDDTKEASAEARNKYFHSVSTLEGLRRRLGLHAKLSTEESIALVGRLWEQYIQSTIGLKKEVTENGPGDELAMLCGHILLDLYHKEKNLRYILDAAVLLEYARVISKKNFQIKLLLMHLYSLIQALQAAVDIYGELEVRHIQMDSLSYLILDPLIRHAFYDRAHLLCQKIRKFHDSRKRDIPDHMVGPYRSQNYTKIQEFIELSSKLERSHQLAITRTEEALLLTQSLTDFPSAHKYLTSTQTLVSSSSKPFPYTLVTSAAEVANLSANQDKTIMVRWDPPFTSKDDIDPFYRAPDATGITSANIVTLNRADQYTWLRIRGLVAKLLAASVPLHAANEEEGAAGKPGSGKGGKGGRGGKGGGKQTPTPAAAPKKEETEKPKQSPEESFKVYLDQLLSLLPSVLPGVTAAETTDLRAFDENNWRIVAQYFVATHTLLRLIATAEANVGQSEPFLAEFKGQLSALVPLLNGMSEHVANAYYHGTTEAGNKAFNIFSVSMINAYAVETLGWLVLLLLNWAMAMPSKKRKGPIAKVFQQARAYVREVVDAVANCFAKLHPLLKEQTDPGTHKSILPFAAVSPLAFIAQCQDEALKSVVTELTSKLSGSYILSLQNMAEAVDKKQHLVKSVKALL